MCTPGSKKGERESEWNNVKVWKSVCLPDSDRDMRRVNYGHAARCGWERKRGLYRNCVPVHQPKDGMSLGLTWERWGTNEGGLVCELISHNCTVERQFTFGTNDRLIKSLFVGWSHKATSPWWPLKDWAHYLLLSISLCVRWPPKMTCEEGKEGRA